MIHLLSAQEKHVHDRHPHPATVARSALHARIRETRPVRPRPFACSVVMLAAALLSVGCRTHKITVDEFLARQAEVPAPEPVSVDTGAIQLTEIKPYGVGVGDVLSITMYGVEERYKPTLISSRVNKAGEIILPLVGRLNVRGKALIDIEQIIVDAHTPDLVKDIAVFVELVGPENTTVVVTGAAEHPGLVSLRQNERNLLYALAHSGGFGPTASNLVELRPIHSDRPVIEYDLTNIDDIRRALLAPPLHSGDVIHVASADTSAVYITGLANAPGPIAVPRGSEIPLTQAIAAAGGLNELLRIKKATLIRRLPDGEKVSVDINLKKVYSGEEPELAMVSGDILQIPHTVDTRFQDWFNTNVLRSMSVGVRYDPLQQYNTNRLLQQQNDANNSALRDSVLLNFSNLLIPPVTATP